MITWFCIEKNKFQYLTADIDTDSELFFIFDHIYEVLQQQQPEIDRLGESTGRVDLKHDQG